MNTKNNQPIFLFLFFAFIIVPTFAMQDQDEQKKLSEQLINAVTKHNTSEAKRLLEARANPDYSAKAPLAIATAYNMTEIVQILLEHTKNIKIANNSCYMHFGKTLLTCAVQSNNYELVRSYVKIDHDLINQRDFDNHLTPLEYALTYNHDEIAQFLLHKGAIEPGPSDGLQNKITELRNKRRLKLKTLSYVFLRSKLPQEIVNLITNEWLGLTTPHERMKKKAYRTAELEKIKKDKKPTGKKRKRLRTKRRRS